MDLLQRAISSDRRFRVVAAVTTDLVREACRRHEIGGAEAIVLGRALTAGCLLSTLTKTDKERARLELRGSGPLGRVLIDSRSDGSVRGFIQRPEEASASPLPGSIGGRIRVGDLVGSGLLVVTRDIGLENPYQGVVELSTGEIDEDIELYLGRSEQLPSALGCDVVLDAHGGVLRAAGVLCQTFPGGTPEEIGELRGSLFGGSLGDLLRQERTPSELIGFALGGEASELSTTIPLVFRCHCDPARARAILASLGADDLDDLAGEPGPTEVRCSYCGARYSMTPSELHALADELRSHRS
ncbi:MAG: Hsp33 family molecular chaperone HslO [Myxococcales bacterium]|nr:Hsp33 family molecular chaperone HslO [Myxococcales bacterium]MCB9700645.1 Hsp33 family molecular chaperone HslO [Myxococcales bacterium]